MKMIYLPLWIKVLTTMKKGDSLSDVFRRVRVSYQWVFMVCQEMERLGFIVTKKRGRRRVIVSVKDIDRCIQKIMRHGETENVARESHTPQSHP